MARPRAAEADGETLLDSPENKVKSKRVMFGFGCLGCSVWILVFWALWHLSRSGKGGGEALQECATTFRVPDVVKAQSKGVCIDDTTLRDCPNSIPLKWPHSDAKISSIRLFKAWGSGKEWNGFNKKKSAWNRLVSHVKENNIKVLVGTQVTCERKDDDKDWENVKGLMERLGPDNVMGLGIGNEMDLLCAKDYVDDACCSRIWDPSEEYPKGYYYALWEDRLNDLNAMDGFQKTKLTPVFSGMALAGNPFYNCDNKNNCAKVNDLITNILAVQEYKERFVFSLNSYPYFWDQAYMDPSGSTCKEALEYALGTGPESYLGAQIISMRKRMTQVLNGEEGVLWIGETGWSTPAADTLGTAMKNCEAWSSVDSFKAAYEGFAGWDLNVAGAKPPDHAFYFTLRDAVNFGIAESFGLISNCNSPDCKLSPASGDMPALSTELSKCSAVPGCANLTQNNEYCCPNLLGEMLDCCRNAFVEVV